MTVDRIERWTFAGRRCDESAKNIQAFYRGPEGKFRVFDFNNKNRAVHQKIIGGLYDVEAIKNGDNESYRLAGAKYVGRVDDENLIIEWQAADRTVDATIKARRMLKEGQNDALEAAMLPLRRAYSKLPYPQRPAFELWVIGRLKRGELA